MKFSEVKVGEILSNTMYVGVYSKGVDSIEVNDTAGKRFTIKGEKLIEGMLSSSQYDSEETVSKTRAAEILVGAGDAVFTVVFKKADGKIRTLIGHLLNTENLLGRSDVRDLLITSGNPLRQVDHREIISIILKGVKYTVKK